MRISLCKADTPFTVWSDIAGGKISGEEALMKQMYKVNGDFNFMIRWDHYFGNADDEIQKSKADKVNGKTNMMILLLPWIVFWVAASDNGYRGSLISIISCGVVSLVFHKNKKTVYDTISNAAIIIFSVLGLSKI